jgi:hypothetical protein
MNAYKSRLHEDEGGLDFVQIVIGLLIISIAAVGTFQSLFWGYEQLDFQMRYRKAISIARSYAEYWQGRIHTDFPSSKDASFRSVKAGNLSSPLEVLLDQRDPARDDDDIVCKIAYAPLVPVDLNTTGSGIDYWEIVVRLTWYEPNSELGSRGYDEQRSFPHEIVFYTAMTYSTL